MERVRTILFLCPHNAAKSVLAIAEFTKLAQQRGLSFRADSAGTEPADAAAPAVVAALRAEGIDVADHRLRRVTREDLATAYRIVSIGCDVGFLTPPGTTIVSWDDVPPASGDLNGARGVIRQHVAQLVAELAEDQGWADHDVGEDGR